MLVTFTVLVLAAGGSSQCGQGQQGLPDCDADGGRAVQTAPVQPAVAMPDAEPESIAEAGPRPKPEPIIPVIDKYLVQVGAFRDQAVAARVAAGIDGEMIVIVPVRRAGEDDWYLLVLGSYPDAGTAKMAGQRYQQQFPRGTYWVRTIAGVRKISRSFSSDITTHGMALEDQEAR